MNKELSLIINCNPKEEARRLRNTGLSIRQISKKLDISISSIRNMVKDIIISDKCKKLLLSQRKKRTIETFNVNMRNNILEIKGKIKIKYLEKNGRPTKNQIIECLSEIINND